MKTTLMAIGKLNEVIKDIGTVEFYTVKEVLAGDVRKIGDEVIVVNDNIPIVCLLQIIVPDSRNAYRIIPQISERWNSYDGLLAACKNSPAAEMFVSFANFAEQCTEKPSMAVYKSRFLGLATFLRSCVDRAEKMKAAIAKAKVK